MDFRNFSIPNIFGSKTHSSMFLEATMSEWPRKFRSTSGFTGARGYCRLGLMDFHSIFIPYVFEVKESISRSFTKLLTYKAMIGWPRKTRSTSDISETRGYWWFCLMDFRKFSIPYDFKVKEFISRCFSKLPCLHIPGDLEYPGQLPVFANGNLVA